MGLVSLILLGVEINNYVWHNNYPCVQTIPIVQGRLSRGGRVSAVFDNSHDNIKLLSAVIDHSQ